MTTLDPLFSMATQHGFFGGDKECRACLVNAMLDDYTIIANRLFGYMPCHAALPNARDKAALFLVLAMPEEPLISRLRLTKAEM